jgi:hypothetical protein
MAFFLLPLLLLLSTSFNSARVKDGAVHPVLSASNSDQITPLPVLVQRQAQEIYFPALAQSQAQEFYLPVISNSPLPFTFISWADSHGGTSMLKSLSNQAKILGPVFTIFPGDLEVHGFQIDEMRGWVSAMDGWSRNGMAEIVFPLRGNHDDQHPEEWQRFFSLEERGCKLGVWNYASLDEDLTFSFDYSNAHFVGIDVPGDVRLITERQLAFLDEDLSAAEARNLSHAFLFFHGPIYPIRNSPCQDNRVCPTGPVLARLVGILNKHPIVSASFHGHSHLQGYAHLDVSRIPEVTHPFEHFISGGAGGGLHNCSNSSRYEYCGVYNGYIAVYVDGDRFSVSFYEQGRAEPKKTFTFVKK